MCIDVEKPGYRFIVLFFNCLLTFGSYFCFDMPSVLQNQMQQDYCRNSSNSSINTTCCEDCLGMTGSQYNLLYAVYSWMNAFVVIGAGFFIDKFGNQAGALLFSTLCVIGSSIFAVGTMYRGTATILPLMLLGRLLFGAGNGSLSIVQNRITSFWFSNKELALAFGITLAFSRLGSVLNFFLTGHLYDLVGLWYTLWIGASLCGIGFASAIAVGILDVHGFKKMGRFEAISVQSKNVHIKDVTKLSALFWLITFTIVFFYNGTFPFVADASKFIEDKYGYDPNPSAYMAGAVYDVSLFLSPFLGGMIDIFGKRAILFLVSSLLTIPVFGLLAFSQVHPLVSTIWLGFTYSVAAASLWSAIPLVVPQAFIGTAMGIATSLQMVGVGISNLIVGEILGKNENLPREDTLLRWKYVMIYLLANTLACVATSVFANIYDSKSNNVLNARRKRIVAPTEDAQIDESDTKSLVSPINEPL